MPPWRFLIRFTDTDGVEHLGEPNVGSGDDVIPAFETGALKATVLETSSIFTRDVRKLGVVAVEKLLSPLRPSDVPMIKCVGLNYMKHSRGTTPLLTAPDVKGYNSQRGRTNSPALSLHLYQAVRLRGQLG